MTKDEASLRIAESYVGIRESGQNNTGPIVEMFQRADSLPGEIYAWCQSFGNGCWRLATGGRVVKRGDRYEIVGGEMLADGTASVGYFVEWCRKHGHLILDTEAPARGDHLGLEFSGDRWADHYARVSAVTRVLPGLLYLVTIEGNTGPSGSVSDPGSGRDGVYKKRRIVRRSQCWIARIPGNVPDPEPRTTKPWPRPLPKFFWPWASWRLGEGEYLGRGYPDIETRPKSAPAIVPPWAWRRLKAFVADRSKVA